MMQDQSDWHVNQPVIGNLAFPYNPKFFADMKMSTWCVISNHLKYQLLFLDFCLWKSVYSFYDHTQQNLF